MARLQNELGAKEPRCRRCGAPAEYLKSDDKTVATVAGLWYSFTCIKCGAQCLLPRLTFLHGDKQA
jgi:hypothetical protein